LKGVKVQTFASVFDRRRRLVEGPNRGPRVTPDSDELRSATASLTVRRPKQAGTYEIAIEAHWPPKKVKKGERSAQFVVQPDGLATLPSLKIEPAGPGTVAAQLVGNTTQQYCPPSCSLTFSKGQRVTLKASPTRQGVFVGWTGCPSTTAVCVLKAKASGDTIVGAAFGRTHVLGHASSGKPITALELGDPAAKRKVLVVGCLKLSECQGTAIADALAKTKSLPDLDLWIIEKLNPDGDGDSGNTDPSPNKNFPCEWVKDPPYNGIDYSDYTKDCAGRAAPSQPEAKAAFDLVKRIRPALTVWYLGRTKAGAATPRGKTYPAWVAEVGGPQARKIERRFALLVGLQVGGEKQKLQPPGGYPGSGSAWQAHTFPGDIQFWVELPFEFSRADAEKHAKAILTIARDL
jgi:hypothetical protein